jgi:hypothetical protein
LNNWVSLGVGLCASKLMVMMCLGILTHLAVLGCYNIKPGHDDGDTQIEHVSWDSARQQNFSPRFVPIQVLMASSGVNLESSVDVVVGRGSWVICVRRVYIRCACVSRKSSVLSWVVGRWVRCRKCKFNCHDVWVFVCPALFVVMFVVSLNYWLSSILSVFGHWLWMRLVSCVNLRSSIVEYVFRRR